ncbi:MAG: hypothetical protein LAO77_10620 [Acidobacteriia bacterium]|nr:hypothetical protein [Terriglobia bacterium]
MAALIAVAAGAASSIYFMLLVGHRQVLLTVLFTIWVLAPFVAVVLADVLSTRRPVLTRTTLYGVMLILAVVSPAIYGNVALGPPRPQPAFWFLMVPFGSCLLLAIAIPLATFLSGRR